MQLPDGYKEWNIAQHLTTEAEIQAYLLAVLEEDGDNPAFVMQAIADCARARGISKTAQDAGISRSGLYKLMSANTRPEYASISKLLRAFGLKLGARPISNHAC